MLNGFRYEGNFSTRGCFLNPILSTPTKSVCECNHLTHFAILLSSNPLELGQVDRTVLNYIGYIGVSISLVAMALTIFTFVAMM